jgi:hypothetical protein
MGNVMILNPRECTGFAVKITVGAAFLTIATCAKSAEPPRCDGTADDAPAINEQLRAAGAKGGEVKLPIGKCIIRSTLTPPSGVTLAGEGIGKTIIQAEPRSGLQTVDFPIVRFGDYNAPPNPSNFSGIHDLTVDGGAQKPAKHRLAGEVVVGPLSRSNRIWRIEARHAGDNGIESSGIETEIAFNYVHDNWANGIYVIGYFAEKSKAIYRASRVMIHDNLVSHNSIANRSTNDIWDSKDPSWDGIDIDPMSENCVIANNIVEGNDIILFESAAHVDAAVGSYGHRIENNIVKNSPENGIDITGYIHNSRAVNNDLISMEGWGFFLNTSGVGNIIEGNRIKGASKGGVFLTNQSKFSGIPQDWIFANNEIANIGGRTIPDTGYRLLVGNNICIRGGSIKDDGRLGLMHFAVDLSSAVTVELAGGNMCPGKLGLGRPQ